MRDGGATPQGVGGVWHDELLERWDGARDADPVDLLRPEDLGVGQREFLEPGVAHFDAVAEVVVVGVLQDQRAGRTLELRKGVELSVEGQPRVAVRDAEEARHVGRPVEVEQGS